MYHVRKYIKETKLEEEILSTNIKWIQEWSVIIIGIILKAY